LLKTVTIWPDLFSWVSGWTKQGYVCPESAGVFLTFQIKIQNNEDTKERFFTMSVFHKAAVFLMVLGLTLPSLGYAIEATPCPTGVLKDGIEQTRHVPATNWPNPTFEMPSGSYPNDRLARPFAWERRGEIGLAGSDWVYTDPLGLPGYEENRPYANDVVFVRDEDSQGRRWGWVPMQNAA
jgi:hypothetical protein